MSSNIQQKKTAPPGSWPCNKGEEATSSGQHQQHQTQTPRSPPPVPDYQGGYIKSNNGGTTTDSQSGEYTHRDRQASAALQKQKQNVQQKGEQVLDQADGETNGAEQETEQQAEQDSEKPIELKDVDPQPESEAAEVDDVNIQDKAAEAATTVPGEGEEAELTENAKKAFDRASENQPTDEARNSFLKAARGGLSFVSRSARSVVGGGNGGGEGQSVAAPEEQGEKQEEGPVDTEVEEGEGKLDDVAEEKVDVPEEGEKGEETIAAADITEGDEPAAEGEEQEGEKAVDFSILKDGTVNKGGNVINASGAVVGRVAEGEIKTLVGKEVDEKGAIWSRNGKIIGKAEPIPDDEREEIEREAAPFESFPEAVIDKDGWVVSADGERIGKVEEGDLHALRGKTVDADGDILDKNGNVIGKAKRWEEAPEPEPEPEPKVDNSALAGKRVNKAGNVVDSNGAIWGRVVEGELKKLVGRMCDKNGNVVSESGDVLGRAELVPEAEREGQKEGPFAEMDECTVGKDGTVVTPAGDIVGRLVSGDGKALFGRAVDEDGDVLDKNGNVIGHAERWAPEPEPEEPEVDKSILAGKRVNKAGNVVDGTGAIFGRVIEGDAKRMVGRMCDKNGNILSESGDILGKADLVSEGEREGLKEGPFAELQGCTVAKDGTVVTPSGDIVGRLTSGDGKVLFGRAVDEDGDVLDRNGNTIGHAERWEPEPVERKKNPMSGRRVNREGNVVDEDGNLIGKLTSGELTVCSGKDIDDDGDVVDYKGNTVGHCSLLEDIPKEEETPEEKEKREQAEQDKKLAVQMTVCVEQCLDSIRPICKMITEKIDKAERTPEEERDEEALVQEVKPLIEEGGRILNEAKGIIKGLDPEGRIAANAKHKTAAREATPEEYRLADVLKDLTGDVTQCIDNAKRKLEDMPHAKKELNPLWGLLNEPLFQILAAVGLLLSGVLNLVGRLLSGLGLGGLVDGLLGTLGLNRVLESLGLGSFSGSLKSGKKKGGGLLGGVLGG